MRYMVLALGLWLSAVSYAQEGWFVQMGGDMSLQNPYGHNFGKSFEEGRSFGVDVALGRWFTPMLALRGKLNWENGLTKSRGNWLAPFDMPGENHRKGGYITFVGDAMLNVKQMFGVHSDKWQPYVFLRAGGAYNFGVSKGTPLLGSGFGTTYRLNDRWSIFADMAYNAVSSGFVGVEKDTGTGSNSNGFLDVNVGVMFELSTKNTEERRHSYRHTDNTDSYGFTQNRLFDKYGWFVQGALDMTLVNAYGKNFADVFPKGKTFGIVMAVGKWFSPEIALRARFKMDNNIVKNGHLEWIGPLKEDGLSKNNGFGVVSADVLISVLRGEGRREKERGIIYYGIARAGLVSNFSTHSGSPLVGLGLGVAFPLSGRLSLVSEVVYQVSTSEFYSAGTTTGMSVSKGSNGFLDINVGIQYSL